MVNDLAHRVCTRRVRSQGEPDHTPEHGGKRKRQGRAKDRRRVPVPGVRAAKVTVQRIEERAVDQQLGQAGAACAGWRGSG